MKQIFILLFIIISYHISAQDCKVKLNNLVGFYKGECKNGVANGEGEAIGVDSFTGNFANGYPHGHGRYVAVKENYVYLGNFVKGKKIGKGTLTIHRANLADSIVDGYWKNDNYIGSYPYPYRVTGKSGLVQTVIISADNQQGTDNTIVIEVTSENAGNLSITQNVRKPELKNISVIEGSYTNINKVESQGTRNYYYLLNVSYPFKASLLVDQSQADIEINQPGSWKVYVKLRFDDL